MEQLRRLSTSARTSVAELVLAVGLVPEVKLIQIGHTRH